MRFFTRLLLAVALAFAPVAASVGPSQALTPNQRVILSGAPFWTLPGASVDCSFSQYGCWVKGQGYVPVGSLISVTRAQTVNSYAVTKSGLLVPFAANTPRITDQGFLKEPASTNILTQSNVVSAWTPVTSSASQNIIDPTGLVNSGWTITQTGANGSFSRYQRNIAIANDGTTYTASGFVLKQTLGTVNGYPSLNVALSGGTAVNAGVVIDVVNGAVQTNGGTGLVTSTIVSSGNFWFVSVTFANNSSGNTTLSYQFYPAWNSVYSGSFATLLNGASGFAFGQVEVGTAATTYIPTAAASVTRNADVVAVTGALATLLARNTGSLGIATTKSFNGIAGTLIDSNGSILLGKTSGNTLTDNLVAGLTTINTGTWTGPTKSFISWSPTGRTLSLNQGTAATDTNAMTPSGVFHLGSTSGTSAFDTAYTSRLTAWGSVVPQSFFNVGFTPAALYAWGDSLTAGNEDGTGVTYPNVLAGLYSPARTVVNEGVGGNTSDQILTRFQALSSSWNYATAIWSGRNSFTNPSNVEADIATMVADLTTAEYVVLAIINGEGEISGSTNYNDIVGINSTLSSTYGSHYIDVRSMLVASYNPANPVDVIDHSNDIPPFSLRAVDEVGTISAINATATTFTLTQTSSATVVVNSILTIGSENIYILGISSNNVTSCTRGYAGSTAASYVSGTAYAGTDPEHLNAAGYTLIAQWVYAKIQQLGGW